MAFLIEGGIVVEDLDLVVSEEEEVEDVVGQEEEPRVQDQEGVDVS